MWGFDDEKIHKTLVVGKNEQKCVGYGNGATPGSIAISGVANFGGEGFSQAESTLMVETSEHQTGDRALTVKGNCTIEGKDNFPLIVQGDAWFKSISPNSLAERFEVADKKPKPFDMEHPSQKGWRLRYACIEGPEVGVYTRGRLRNKTEITLPDYWKDLVHTDSISVQLQPIGSHQDIIVKRWDKDKVYLQSNGGMPIDCFYHVYAERKDVNALVTEYQGSSWKDYPDPEYDDPQYNEVVNTHTK